MAKSGEGKSDSKPAEAKVADSGKKSEAAPAKADSKPKA